MTGGKPLLVGDPEDSGDRDGTGGRDGRVVDELTDSKAFSHDPTQRLYNLLFLGRGDVGLGLKVSS